MNKDLTVGNPSAVLWKFCLPLFGSILFQQLYNIADSLAAIWAALLSYPSFLEPGNFLKSKQPSLPP